MNFVFITDTELDAAHSDLQIEKGEYEQCVFKNFDLSESSLSECTFIDCTFISCNMSSTNFDKTVFRNIKFSDCKILGAHFNQCNGIGFSVRFENCLLDHSVFSQMKLPGTRFHDCMVREVDFTAADLSSSVFGNCDLSGAVFYHSNLEKADFRNARYFTIDPEFNKMKKARFSAADLEGLLIKYDLDIE